MKRIMLSASLIILSSVAMAQQAVPIPPSEYMLRVTPAELDIISDGLQTQPFGKVAPLMQKLRVQLTEQQMPKAVEKPEEKKE